MDPLSDEQAVDGMAGKLCHIDKGPCLKHDCGQYRYIKGHDPQDNAPIKRWDCAIANQQWMQIEQAAQSRQMANELHAFTSQVMICAETLLVASGRSDMLAHMRARLDHVAALTRTADLNKRNERLEKGNGKVSHSGED